MCVCVCVCVCLGVGVAELPLRQHAYFDYGRRVDKSLGRKSKSDSSDSDGGMSSDSWEEHANAHNKYWEAECEVRVRTSGLTKKEVDMLMLRGDCTPDRQAVVENPINHVNAGPVCTGWVLDMLEEGTEGCAEMQLGPGEKVPTSKALWSLLKVIMNSERKADQFKSSSLAGCRCLNASYFMPHGCSHTKPGMSGYIMGGISMQLCSTCSKCLRCGGLLGWDGVQVVVWCERGLVCMVGGMGWHDMTEIA